NCSGISGNPAQLPTITKRLLADLSVKGRHFPQNAAWFEWASDNGCLPTEEDYLEGTRDAMEMKDSGIIYAHSNAAASEDDGESNTGTIYALSDTTSDVVPSFAKIRFAFDPEDKGTSWGPYAAKRSPSEVESQRILIWHPHDYRDPDAYT
ncbi:hypothetical protein TSMEX_011785, partial [Taenia solium]